MADLTVRTPRQTERGQILLVAAFALSVTFVVLALVVNAAIFTENLASRGQVSGSADALDQRHEVVQSVGATVEYVNEHNHTDLSVIEGNVENISRQMSRQQLALSRTVNVSYVTDTEGERIAQFNASNRQFTNESGNATDWELAEGVGETRAVSMNVTDITSLNDSSGSSFTLVADGTNSWEMDVWQSDPGEVTVRVTRSGEPEAECVRSVADGDVQIDVTDGLIDGEPCHALIFNTSSEVDMAFAAGISNDYDIRFENGDAIAGNYSMVVDGSDAVDANLDDSPSGSPFVTDAIYGVTVEYVYETPNVLYVTEIQEIAPGEPR